MTPDNLREMLASAALHASIPDGPALAVLIASTNWFRIRHENPDDIDGARMLFSAVGLAAADAALAALRDAGFAIVPKEPSEAMIAAVSDQAWRGGYCTERPQQNYSGGSALFTEAEATPMVRAMFSAWRPAGGEGVMTERRILRVSAHIEMSLRRDVDWKLSDDVIQMLAGTMREAFADAMGNAADTLYDAKAWIDGPVLIDAPPKNAP